MATPLRMPDMGGAVRIVAWLKGPGDTVTLGEPLLEVETDKGVTAVESPLPGVIESILLPTGSMAGPDEPIARIKRWGE